MLSLYNTLTRTKEGFSSIIPGKIGIYACGPTVYWFAHIGNMRTNLFVDVLRRTLALNGFDVHLVMNITDVGHLTDDEDTGEDKMIIAMKREGKTALEIAEFYTQQFFQDIHALNILPAREYPRATEHIDEQIQMIVALEKNGFTYITADGVYFDTAKLPNYGRLSGQEGEDKQAGARVSMGEKKNATDFALWKFSKEDAHRQMEWESPWGIGFPGWHIECSAMSKKYLGVPFDIHTGGIDHIAVHHENELAQTQGADGCLQANVWMHGEFLTMDGGKMSKSLGNLFTIDQLKERGFDPLAYRYFVLGAHYRSKLNFTFDALEAAQNALRRLRNMVRQWDTPSEPDAVFVEKFTKAINDDLNTPQALAVLWELVDTDLPLAIKSATVLFFDQVFGLALEAYVAKPVVIPKKIEQLLARRRRVREEKNWTQSDALRDEIATLGFVVEDTPGGQVVSES